MDECNKWQFTRFYGSPYYQEREATWRLLRQLRQTEENPWMVCGGFNEILYGFEKKYGLIREEERMKDFRKVLKDCNLIDLGFSGNWFTLEIGNLPETNIQELLDKGVANDVWVSLFPEYQICHLPHSFSDHCPLLITTRREIKKSAERKFKFEAWWVLEESFLETVRNLWDTSTVDLLHKLDCVRKGLQNWANGIRHSRKIKKDILHLKMAKLLEEEISDDNMEELIDTKFALNLEIENDKRYWEQRARINWLKLGDKNTAFFHKQATQRIRWNLIQKLQLEDGMETEVLEEMEEIARSYF
ncbi:uncharacterized protein LOC108468293 [Gossypium arboreum]|uniref:uncharacterized protein LOC108468293 n=1 Tax=Gossypium arboreum TaxID=29729 RepID=UPI0008196367|nr:uncharacterized protein LOC108468293 [Gossypium arboreum]